jgi:hypothetical protein
MRKTNVHPQNKDAVAMHMFGLCVIRLLSMVHVYIYIRLSDITYGFVGLFIFFASVCGSLGYFCFYLCGSTLLDN